MRNTAVFSTRSGRSAISFASFEVWSYLAIGPYLPFFTYSISRFFGFFNMQFVTNSQLFFVQNAEIRAFAQFPLYKRKKSVI